MHAAFCSGMIKVTSGVWCLQTKVVCNQREKLSSCEIMHSFAWQLGSLFPWQPPWLIMGVNKFLSTHFTELLSLCAVHLSATTWTEILKLFYTVKDFGKLKEVLFDVSMFKHNIRNENRLAVKAFSWVLARSNRNSF